MSTTRMLMRAALLLLGTSIGADVVHLKSGGTIEGRVTEKGDKLDVDTGRAVITLSRDEVARIEKKEFSLPPTERPKKLHVKLGGSYAHPFLAFKIYLPPRWAQGKPHGSAHVTFWGPRDQFYQPRMDLRVEATSKDLAAFAGEYKAAFSKTFKDVRFVFEEASQVRGQTAVQFSVVLSDGDPPVRQQALFTFVGDGRRIYVLSFSCSEAWFEKYYGMLDASMRSLRLYPVPSADKEKREAFLRHYNAAETAYREGRLADALAGFKAAAGLVPEFAEIHSNVALVYMKQNKFPDAQAAYQKAVDLDPGDASHHYNLGVCLLRQSKYEGATPELLRATELEPVFEPALTNLGVAYLARDQNDLARAILERAVLTDPESAPAHYNLGLAYERLDRPKDAAREYGEALKIDPKHAAAREALGRVRK